MLESWQNLVDGVKEGRVISLARCITRVENREPGWKGAMKAICAAAGSARVIGITGPPGAGKSTLTGKIASCFAGQGLQVGVIAIDPSSPFSGGAILGDRLRMIGAFADSNIYIRSMATRGALGGLCQAARDVARIMDAFGKDIILIETVGVGQDEIEVVKAADLVAVVSVPGQGDGVQAIKAGIMEIADIFVVNKADREGADDVVADISGMLNMSCERSGPIPSVIKTTALENEGINDLVELMTRLLDDQHEDRARDEKRVKEELLLLIEREISQHVTNIYGRSGVLDKAVQDIMSRSSDPYSVVDILLPGVETVLSKECSKQYYS